MNTPDFLPPDAADAAPEPPPQVPSAVAPDAQPDEATAQADGTHAHATADAPVPPESGPEAPPASPREPAPHYFSFAGDGTEFFGVYIVGIVLSVLTLSVYYPWFRAATLRYLYEKTELLGSRWTFIGSGREMFVGYVKFLMIAGGLYALYTGGLLWLQNEPQMAGVAMLLIMVAFFGYLTLGPLAIHGVLRYRLSRSVWRGIHAGYVGRFGPLFGHLIGGQFLSYVSIGIYYPTFQADLYRYLLPNLRFGSLRPVFKGTSDQLWEGYRPYYLTLVTAIVGLFFISFLSAIMGPVGAVIMILYLLVMVCLVVYRYFDFKADFYNWIVENSTVVNDADGRRYRLMGHFTMSDVFQLQFVNVLLLIISLGIAYPWVITRNLEFFYANVGIDGSIDPDTIVQTQAPDADAAGEGILDFLDIGLA